jgi:hypothetical protein
MKIGDLFAIHARILQAKSQNLQDRTVTMISGVKGAV